VEEPVAVEAVDAAVLKMVRPSLMVSITEMLLMALDATLRGFLSRITRSASF
jgi:hypothetical protein